MAYTYSILRASSKIGDDGFVVTPSGTIVNALQDSSDSSYIRKPASSNTYFVGLNIANPASAAPASGSFLVDTYAYLRCSQGAGGYLSIALGSSSIDYSTVSVISGTQTVNPTLATVSSASRASTGIVSVTTAAAHGLAVGDVILIQGSTGGTPSQFLNASYVVLTAPTSTTFTAQDIRGAQTASTVSATNGNISIAGNVVAPLALTDVAVTGATAQTLINGLTVSVNDSSTSAGRAYIYELYVAVVSAALPTVSISDIDGDSAAPYTATTTSRPTLNWVTNQADGIAQTQYRVKVFTSAQSDPDTATGAVFDSGIVASATGSCQITTDLTNSTTYYAYVKVSASSVTDDGWSTWGSGVASSFIQFSTSYTAPTAPTVSPVWGATQQRVRATLTGAAVTAPMTAQTFDLQRSDDGGVSWTYVRNGVTRTPDGSYQVIVDDFEMKRGVTVRYRARSVATGAGSTIASAWGTVATVAVPALTEWTLRSLNATGEVAIAKDVKVLADLELNQEESVGVFRPLGRSTTLTVHGDLTGQDGTFKVLCTTQTKFDDLLAVINGQRLILVADPYGEQKYVRVTSRSWVKAGAAASPRYEVDVAYVQVESGLTAG